MNLKLETNCRSAGHLFGGPVGLKLKSSDSTLLRAFPVVDASTLSSDSTIEQLVADYDSATTLLSSPFRRCTRFLWQ